MGRGRGGAVEFQFPGSISAIGKNEDAYYIWFRTLPEKAKVPAPPDSDSEVLAYRWDHVHRLSIVPVTIKTLIDHQVWSLQYKVRDTSHGWMNYRFFPYLPRHWRLYFLDFSLHQKDRIPDNYLVRFGGDEVGIDNSIIYRDNYEDYFHRYKGEVNYELGSLALPTNAHDLIKLSAPSLVEIYQATAPYLSAKTLKYILERRREFLLAALNKKLISRNLEGGAREELERAREEITKQSPACFVGLQLERQRAVSD